MPATERLFWLEGYPLTCPVQLLGGEPGRLLFDRTPVFPGGGGQPADMACVCLPDGETRRILAVETGPGDELWHVFEGALEPLPPRLPAHCQRRCPPPCASIAPPHRPTHRQYSRPARLWRLDHRRPDRRGVYSRIDFKIEDYTPALLEDLTRNVNQVIRAGHSTRAFFLPEAEFARRPDLLRTLEVKPPVRHGQVCIVAIDGFDEQACVGTHAPNTLELGRPEIFKTENKGRINKRLYSRLIPA